VPLTPAPSTPAPPVRETVAVAAGRLPAGKFQEYPVPGPTDQDRYLSGLLVATKGHDRGVLQVRQDDVVIFEVELGAAGERFHDLRGTVPAGQRLTVAMSCAKTSGADGLCRAGVTFQFGPGDR
jgi:hypothetical protein